MPNNAAWSVALQCDPSANWISTAPGWPSRSALYSAPFNVAVPAPCCIQNAKLDFCWMVDDALGDVNPFGGPNPAGVYLNGIPLPIDAGNRFNDTVVSGVDITNAIRCGNNHLYVYNRDLGCAVAGVVFSARITYFECVTPSKQTSWGAIRAIYRD